ncbi:MAG: CorA family divalent cation transporter [Deferrisomatales bacterium]|nr:CorA family divalent cation transporter [Deferrisomatales bacterium]
MACLRGTGRGQGGIPDRGGRDDADRTTRYVEDRDSIRGRATVSQDALNGKLSEPMDKTTYVIFVVDAIFVPLGPLTGLLGINAGGIPGTESPVAFTLVRALLLVVAAPQAWLFRRMPWI